MAAKSPKKVAVEHPRLLRGPLKDQTNTSNSVNQPKDSQKSLKTPVQSAKAAIPDAPEQQKRSQNIGRAKKVPFSSSSHEMGIIPSVEDLLTHIDGLTEENRLLATRLNELQTLVERQYQTAPSVTTSPTNFQAIRAGFVEKLEGVLNTVPVPSISNLDTSTARRVSKRLSDILTASMTVAQECLKTQVSLLAMQLKVQKLGQQDLAFLYSVLLRFHPDSAQMDPHKVLEVSRTVGLSAPAFNQDNKPVVGGRGMGIFANSSSSIISTPSFGDSTFQCKLHESESNTAWEAVIKNAYAMWMWLLLKIGPEQSLARLEGSEQGRPLLFSPIKLLQSSCLFGFGTKSNLPFQAGQTHITREAKSQLLLDPELVVLPTIIMRPSGQEVTEGALVLKFSYNLSRYAALPGTKTQTLNLIEPDRSLMFNPQLKDLNLSTEIRIKDPSRSERSQRDKPVKSSLSGRSMSKENPLPESARNPKKSVKFSERCSVLEYETELQLPAHPRVETPSYHPNKSVQFENKGSAQMIKAKGLIEFEHPPTKNFERMRSFDLANDDKENIPHSAVMNWPSRPDHQGLNALRKNAINLKELELNPKLYTSKRTTPVPQLPKDTSQNRPGILTKGGPLLGRSVEILVHKPHLKSNSIDDLSRLSQVDVSASNGYRRWGEREVSTLEHKPHDHLHDSRIPAETSRIRPEEQALRPKNFIKQTLSQNFGPEANESGISRSEDDSVLMSQWKRAEFEGLHAGSMLQKRSSSQQQLRSKAKIADPYDEKDSLLHELRSHRLQRTTHLEAPEDKSMQLRSVHSDTSLLGRTRASSAKVENLFGKMTTDSHKRLLDSTPMNMEAFRRSIDMTLSRNQQLLAKTTGQLETNIPSKAVRPWFGITSLSNPSIQKEDLQTRIKLEKRAPDPTYRQIDVTNMASTRLKGIHPLSSSTLLNSADQKPLTSVIGQSSQAATTPRSDRGHSGTSTYLKLRGPARPQTHRSSLQLTHTGHPF